MLLNNQWITEEIKEEIKNIPKDKWKRKHGNQKLMECSKKSSKGEVYSNKILSQETRKISNKQFILKTKATRERRKSKAQI